jgi:hypothetical protein
MHDQWSGPELDSLIGKTALNRREMMMTTLAVGFAAATLPVHAETVITTSAEGLTAGEVKIPVADGEIPAYRAMPATGGPFPVVLVVQETLDEGRAALGHREVGWLHDRHGALLKRYRVIEVPSLLRS